jgi:predicted esterase
LTQSDPFQFSQASNGAEEEEAVTFCKDQGEPTIFLVNLDQEDASERSAIPLQLNLSAESGQYICDNWIGMAPLDGAPLEHGTTYALIITEGIRSEWGDVPIQDRDFRDILSGSLSVDAMLPLLNWLTSRSIPIESIAGATVFTTADPDAHAAHLRKAVHLSSPQPTFGEAFLCDNSTTPAPCSQTPCRPIPSNLFHEMRGTYNTPLFQTGTRPYKTPLDGGNIPRKSGVPLPPTQSESVCFSASIPKHILPPAKGWPVVIFSHGTGGNFATLTQHASFLAEALAATGFAAISFDGVLHGDRSGPKAAPSLSELTSLIPSSQYFFNLVNPQASRDNVLQGSADLFQVVNLIQKDPGGLTKAQKGARLDPTRIYFIGHSQGAAVASAFIAAETALKGAVLGGVGADTVLKVLHQESPLSLKTVAGFLFADTNLTRIHPMMGALSTLLGESDMGNYARTFVGEPIDGRSPHSLLLYSGINDTYAPTLTHNALIRMMQLPLIGPALSPVSGIAHTPQSPVNANVNGVTAGAVQFSSGSSGICPPLCDGHFVMLNSPEALQTLTTFLTTDTIQR